MVVTTSIELERILLHSGATSSVNPGMWTNMPCCATGMPTAAKSKRADAAEPRCSRLTIGFIRKCGRGTIQNKKQRAKSDRRTARLPKQNRNAAIHHTTNASMFTASCTSGGRGTTRNLTTAVITNAIASSPTAMLRSRRDKDSGDFQSRNIRVALIGRISNMCVYCSSLSARANEDIRG